MQVRTRRKQCVRPPYNWVARRHVKRETKQNRTKARKFRIMFFLRFARWKISFDKFQEQKLGKRVILAVVRNETEEA